MILVRVRATELMAATESFVSFDPATLPGCLIGASSQTPKRPSTPTCSVR